MNTKYILAIVCLGLAVLIGGCGKEANPGNETGKPARPADELIIVLGDEPKTLDPASITDMISIRVVAGLLEGLTVLNEETLKPEPGMAAAWSVSPDKLTYTFQLREAQWANGDPVTAADFLFAWQRVLEPETGSEYVYMLFPVKNAERFHKGECPFEEVGIKVDGKALRVTLEAPTPYFLDLTSFVTYLPVHAGTVEKHGDGWIKPQHYVGNGPFRLAAHKMKDRIVLKPNAGYYAAETVKLKSLTYRVMTDQTMAYNEYQAGKLDIITSVPVSIFSRIKDRKPADLYVFPGLGIYYVRINVTRKPFNSRQVRQALALAIDNDLITGKVLGAGEIPAAGYVPKGTERHSSFALKETFNPEKARQLLAAAGYPEGEGFPQIEYLYNTSDDNQRIGNAIADMLKKNLNIDMILINMEWKVYLQKMKDLEYDICRSAWYGDYNDPMTFLDMYVTGNGNNRTGWARPEYDSLIKQAFMQQDETKRTALFFKAEKLLLDDMPIIPVYFYVSRFMVDERVGGWYPNTMNWIRPGRLYIKP